jgi:hypothetical protein
MAEPWMKFLPDHAEMHEDRVKRCEHSAVQRILYKTHLSGRADQIKEEGGTNLLTFAALAECTGFPMYLCAAAFKSKQMQKFDLDLEVRPVTTPLFKLFDAARTELPKAQRGTFGLLFAWQGRGKFHVLHGQSFYSALGVDTSDAALQGRWWRIGARLYCLEPLDSLIVAVGDPEEW